MKIGELAVRTGISTRMLRYYEAQGLLNPERSPNGYREFQDGDIERAGSVASLIQSGLTTRLVAIVLSVEDRPEDWTAACDEEFAAILRAEAYTLDRKIACLTRSRAAVAAYLERENQAVAVS